MAHRHSAALDVAESALKAIVEDSISKRRSVDTQGARSERDGTSFRDSPSHQGPWEYLGIQKGVKFYTQAISHADQRSPKASPSKNTAGGFTPDTGLPYFRGEGVIEGDWRLSDLLATIASQGARDVWDERFRASSSQVVAILCGFSIRVLGFKTPKAQVPRMNVFAADRDALLHSSLVFPFPVGPRDTVVASRWTQYAPDQVLYASTSVEDPLVPHGAVTRDRIQLSGWAFRKVAPDEPDDLELMEDEDLEDLQTNNPRRSAQHQRAFSRQFDPLSNPLSTLSRQKSLLSSPAEKRTGRPGLPQRHSGSLAFGSSEAAKTQRAASPGLSSKPKRIRTTLVLKADPGGSLPVTYINSLNISVPLCIDSLSRYLKIYGFAPHLVSRSGLKLLQEKFEAQAGYYNLIFRPLPDAPRQVELRFHGLTFEGRCSIEVKGAEYSVSYDVLTPLSQRESAHRPRLKQRFSTSAAVLRLNESADREVDAAQLPGQEGGTTLTLSLHPDATTVQVVLNKRAPKDIERGVAYFVQIGAAMTRAMAVAEKEMEDLEEERFGQLKRVNHTTSRDAQSEEGESELEKADIMAKALEESFATVTNATSLPKMGRQRDSLQAVKSGSATPVAWS